MAGENVTVLTDENFDEEVLQADTPVLVDFYADWCAPCRMMAPVIEELAGEYQGKVKVAKIDTDAHRDAPSRFGISAIPTIILFQNGEPSRRFVGVTNKDEFKSALDSVTG